MEVGFSFGSKNRISQQQLLLKLIANS